MVNLKSLALLTALSLMLHLPLFSQVNISIPWQIELKIQTASDSDQVVFGTFPGATDLLDVGIDTLNPPPGPMGGTDAYYYISGGIFSQLMADFRSNKTSNNQWNLHIVSTAGQSGTINWNASSFPTGNLDPGFLILNGQDMLATSQYLFADDQNLIIQYQAPFSDLVRQPPGQLVERGQTFQPVLLDTLILDANYLPGEFSWQITSGGKIEILIDSTRLAHFAVTDSAWIGKDTLTFTAMTPDSATESEQTVFQVIPPNKIDSSAKPVFPQEYYLFQNYPNPFNPVTQIPYYLPLESLVQFQFYDISGRLVKTLHPGVQTAGHHSFRLDGSKMAGGVYFYRILAGAYMETRKMILLK